MLYLLYSSLLGAGLSEFDPVGRKHGVDGVLGPGLGGPGLTTGRAVLVGFAGHSEGRWRYRREVER